MTRYAVNVNNISKKRPTEDEARRKAEKYRLKCDLGLLEMYDNNTMDDREYSIRLAGFKDYAEYEATRIKVIQMIDNNIPIPNELVVKLKKAKGTT